MRTHVILVADYHEARDRLRAEGDGLREQMLLAAGELLAVDRPRESAVIIEAAGRLFPDLANFIPCLIGPKGGADV